MSFCQTCHGDGWCICNEPPLQRECEECIDLRAEVERLTNADSFSRKELCRGNEIIDGLRAEVEALRSALYAYGRHDIRCISQRLMSSTNAGYSASVCDCGLDAALAAGRDDA